MLTEVIVTALAAWRLANLLVNEDGPFDVFVRLRTRAGVQSFVTQSGIGYATNNRVAAVFLCVWCMSVWTAALVLLPVLPVRYLRLLLATSAVAILVHEIVGRLRR